MITNPFMPNITMAYMLHKISSTVWITNLSCFARGVARVDPMTYTSCWLHSRAKIYEESLHMRATTTCRWRSKSKSNNGVWFIHRREWEPVPLYRIHVWPSITVRVLPPSQKVGSFNFWEKTQYLTSRRGLHEVVCCLASFCLVLGMWDVWWQFGVYVS